MEFFSRSWTRRLLDCKVGWDPSGMFSKCGPGADLIAESRTGEGSGEKVSTIAGRDERVQPPLGLVPLSLAEARYDC